MIKPFKLLAGLTILALAGPWLAYAAPTSNQQARQAVQGWLTQDQRPLGAKMATIVKNVVSYRDASGEALYHIVFLAPVGLVIVAGDDLIEPIVGFLPQATTYDPASGNPLGALVSADLPGRNQAVRASVKAAAKQGRIFVPAKAMAAAQGRWRKLTAASAAPLLTDSVSISDVRVAPLLQSRWNQQTAAGQACFNYYTPPGPAGSTSNYPAGCVATAMAQLMRFYQYPTTGVGGGSFDITVDGSPRTAILRGGDGRGGPYDWASMPLLPDYGITTAQSQAIGALCYDSGVAVGMMYAAAGSAAYSSSQKDALVTTFKYANAVLGYAGRTAAIPAGFNNMANPNLDAGYPVLLSLSLNSLYNGHAIVCDGYGYNSSTMYHHLNMGWSGAYDAWYNLPYIGNAGFYNFNAVDCCTYNIYPNGAGEIISGRVTTTSGAPFSGVTVTAVKSGGGTYTATTNANGIYAITKIPSNTPYTVSAAKADYSFGSNQTLSIGQSMDYSSSAGNVWGVDFIGTPSIPSLEVTPTTFSATGYPGGPFTPSSATYTVKNIGPGRMDWTVSNKQSWVTLSKAGGSLATGDTDTVTISINSDAKALSAGDYADTVTFFNVVNGHGNTTRAVNLKVYNPNAWTPMTSAAAWTSRHRHAVVVFNNTLWVLGGVHDFIHDCNDVYSSQDGIQWSQVTAAAPWSARSGHKVVVFNNKMYLLGGMVNSSTKLADVWSSSDGADWTQLTATAPWGPRSNMGALAFGGKLWVIGGSSRSGLMNDVWSSSDGVTWTQVASSAPWQACADHCMESFGGRMWLIGGYRVVDGWRYGTVNDVWSSMDGVTWTQATVSTPYTGRWGFASAVIGGRMWIIGGYDGSKYLNDVWSSSDGANWIKSSATVSWPGRGYLGGTAFLNHLFILGGTNGGKDFNDVWRLPVMSYTSSMLSASPEANLNAAGLLGGPFLPASTTCTVSNTGEAAMNWTISKTQPWTTLSKTGGTLAPGTSDTVAIAINSGANGLAIGSHLGTIRLTNVTHHEGDTTRGVSLIVNAPDTWVLATSNTPWEKRQNPALVAFNNKLWVLGGRDYFTFNDVWNSTDGIQWKKVTSAAAWPARSDHATVVLNNKMYLLGGMVNSSNILADVWSSSDGANWTQLTASAPWGKRLGVGVVVFGNKLWVIGGGSDGGGLKNDVWNSDDGITWTQVTSSAPWSARCEHQVESFGGRMWILGGYSGNYLRDVWSSADGRTWRQDTASAPWVGRTDFASAAIGGKLWILGGSSQSSGALNDVWCSTDGANWVQSTAPVPWAARMMLRTCVFMNRLYVIGGVYAQNYTDAWYLPLSSGAPAISVAPVAGLSVSGKSGGPFFPASSSYTVSNTGTAAVNWTATKTPSWMTLSKPGGSLASGVSDTVEVSINTVANALAPGSYHGAVTFTNTIDGAGNTTRGVDLTVSPVIDPSGWGCARASAEFSGRQAHSCLVFNNKLWVIGGYDGSKNLNDVWSSADGITWTQVTGTATFPARQHHSSLVFNNKMWVIGGYTGTSYLNDVWSSADGVTWTKATGMAAFSKRMAHSSVVFGGKMWVLGGYNGSTYLSDVWSSTDGVTWTRTSSAAFTVRAHHTSIVFNDRILTIAGSNGACCSDVWSSPDGVTWAFNTNEGATARDDHACAVFGAQAWLTAGSAPSLTREVWISNDGYRWTKLGRLAAFPARDDHASVVFDGKLWVIGGLGEGNKRLNDVWFYEWGSAAQPENWMNYK